MRRLALAVLALALVAGSRAGAAEVARPVVGAIRWDGWLMDGDVGRAVSKSLTPPHWSYRLPFFAKVREDGSPELRGDTAEVMTAEIAAARTARLDYWAFFTSRSQSAALTLGTREKRMFALRWVSAPR